MSDRETSFAFDGTKLVAGEHAPVVAIFGTKGRSQTALLEVHNTRSGKVDSYVLPDFNPLMTDISVSADGEAVMLRQGTNLTVLDVESRELNRFTINESTALTFLSFGHHVLAFEPDGSIRRLFVGHSPGRTPSLELLRLNTPILDWQLNMGSVWLTTGLDQSLRLDVVTGTKTEVRLPGNMPVRVPLHRDLGILGTIPASASELSLVKVSAQGRSEELVRLPGQGLLEMILSADDRFAAAITTRAGRTQGYVIDLQSLKVVALNGAHEFTQSNPRNRNLHLSGSTFVFGASSPQSLIFFDTQSGEQIERTIGGDGMMADYAVAPKGNGLVYVDRWVESSEQVNQGFARNGRTYSLGVPKITGLPVFTNDGSQILLPYKFSSSRMSLRVYRP